METKKMGTATKPPLSSQSNIKTNLSLLPAESGKKDAQEDQGNIWRQQKMQMQIPKKHAHISYRI